MTLTAPDIVRLLEVKHKEDVFVSECKTGHGSTRRMDAWAMKRSWAHPHVTGYEIKVSRSDFDRDDKWPEYLKFCTNFYFVCPSGLIAPGELPKEIGLMWVSKTGTKLYTKKRAVTRLGEVHEDVYRYVLMHRTTVTRQEYLSPSRQDRARRWEEWLANEERHYDIGHKIQARIREKVKAVQDENRRLRQENEGLAAARELLIEAGLTPDAHGRFGDRLQVGYEVRKLARKLHGDLEPKLGRLSLEARKLQRTLSNMLREVEELNNE